MPKKWQYAVAVLVVFSSLLSPIVVFAEDIFLPLVSKGALTSSVDCNSTLPSGWTLVPGQVVCAVKLEAGYTYKVKADSGWFADGDGADFVAPFDQEFSGPVTFWRQNPNAQPLAVTEVSAPEPTSTATSIPTGTSTMTATLTATPSPTATPTVVPCVLPSFNGWTLVPGQVVCAVKLEAGYTYKVKADSGWFADGDGADFVAPFDQEFSGPVTFWRQNPNAQPLIVTEVP